VDALEKDGNASMPERFKLPKSMEEEDDDDDDGDIITRNI
jgi:hypothetical protein